MPHPQSRSSRKYIRAGRIFSRSGARVHLGILVRRFYCAGTSCARRTFAERLPGLLDARPRRTRRLAAQRAVAIRHRGLGRSGRSPQREARNASEPGHATTAHPERDAADTPETPWALRRGHCYDTILVDLEARRVVELLPDRTGTTLAGWLHPRPKVGEMARDRSTEHAHAATFAAPYAIQAADRWHPLHNAA